LCDNIILRDGTEISAKVEEVGESEIKYKKCENLNGPDYRILKAKVLLIKYSNGTKDIFEQEKEIEKEDKEVKTTVPIYNNINSNSETGKTEGFSIASMIIGITGLIVVWVLSGFVGAGLGLIAVILAAIGLGKINNDPVKFIGKGLAIVGLITGMLSIVSLVVFLVYLAK
jgi:1,4-dihydroxy-2-naphthoate octaprenyltransferase